MEAKVSEYEGETPWEESIPLGPQGAFLSPEHPLTSPAMPDDVWAKLERSLFNEQIAREATSNVVSLDAHRRSKRSWVVGTAAAGMALLGVGVVVQSIQSSTPAAIAAGSPIAANSQGVFPVKQVLASGTDYQPTTLTSQVRDLVHGLPGVQQLMKAAPAQTMPALPDVGEMTTSDGMALCVHALTKDPKIGALVVDVATFHGSAAGIVVIPLNFEKSSATAPAILHVWVVGPHCSPNHPDVMGEFTIALTASGSGAE
jgi:hypothetical protein